MTSHRRPKIAAVDLLCSLLLVILVLIAPPPEPAHRAIDTLGQYAIVASWPPGDNDADVYVRDPAGNVVYFANEAAGLMHLEHDDLGDYMDVRGVNHERVILRGVIPGEYVVNVHGYRLTRSVTVNVGLFRLAGADRRLRAGRVTLPATGAERTAFRFTVGPQGLVTGYSTLPRHLVGATRHP